MAMMIEDEPDYEYCRAICDAEGNLRWEYKLVGSRANVMSHDEYVSEWTNREIVALTTQMLGVPEEMVEVEDE